MEKLESYALFVGGFFAVENNAAVLQKVKHIITMGSSHSPSTFIPRRTERRKSEIVLWTPMFTTALFIIAKSWGQSRCPLMNA